MAEKSERSRKRVLSPSPFAMKAEMPTCNFMKQKISFPEIEKEKYFSHVHAFFSVGEKYFSFSLARRLHF